MTPLLLCAAAMECLLVAAVRMGDWRQSVVECILLYLLAGIPFAVGVWLVWNRPAFRGRSALIALTGVMFRLTVFPVFPAFSDDIFRYRWEGKLQAAGGNPYQTTPDAAEWEHLRDETYPNVVLKNFRGGYGPVIEVVQHGVYRVLALTSLDSFSQVFWFKLPFVLADLGCIAALMAWLGAKGLDPGRAIVYVYSPLSIIEVSVNGHHDSLVVLLVMLAGWAATKQHFGWAGAALTIATAAKFWPVVLFPALVVAAGRRRWMAPVRGALIATGCCVPVFYRYWGDVTENLRFMTGFVGGWRNNDSGFGLLLFLAQGNADRAKILAFAVIVSVVVLVVVLHLSFEKSGLAILVAVLAVSSNCHPWYVLWVLPFFAFALPVPLLLASTLMPFAYAVLLSWFSLGVWEHVSNWRLAIYLPPLALPLFVFVARSFSGRSSELLRRKGTS